MSNSIRGQVRDLAQQVREKAVLVSQEIFAHPELAFREHKAAALLSDTLESAGFHVDRGVAGLPTAFAATAGTGDMVVGICAEYDALPEIGHACGHNIISGAAILAALLIEPFTEDIGITLKIFGTPAEEGGGGKVTMMEQGIFDATDAIMMVHPAPHDLIEPSILALALLDVEFQGVTPPSMNPEQGRSAGDALVISQTAIALLRQHLSGSDRMSGFVRSEGHSPNVLPHSASLGYCFRSETSDGLDALVARAAACFEGAALATGTKVTLSEPSPRYRAFRNHAELAQRYKTNSESLGRKFLDFESENKARSASTDFGNISEHIPAIHPLIGIDSEGFSNHQAPFTDFCGGPSGDQAVFDGGLAMALTIVDVATDQSLRDSIIEERAAMRGAAK